MIKVYIGSSSNFKKECEELALNLRLAGEVEITRAWWNFYIKEETKFKEMTDLGFYAHVEPSLVGDLDLLAIDQADIVVIYAHDSYKMTGAEVELGYALGKGKPVYVVGQIKRSAMHARCIHTDVDSLIAAFRRFKL